MIRVLIKVTADVNALCCCAAQLFHAPFILGGCLRAIFGPLHHHLIAILVELGRFGYILVMGGLNSTYVLHMLMIIDLRYVIILPKFVSKIKQKKSFDSILSRISTGTAQTQQNKGTAKKDNSGYQKHGIGSKKHGMTETKTKTKIKPKTNLKPQPKQG